VERDSTQFGELGSFVRSLEDDVFKVALDRTVRIVGGSKPIGGKGAECAKDQVLGLWCESVPERE
jgi:hypothetical protein